MYYPSTGILADKPLQTAVVSCRKNIKSFIQVVSLSFQCTLIHTGMSTEWCLEGGKFLLCPENDILPTGLHFVFLDNNRNFKVGCNMIFVFDNHL